MRTVSSLIVLAWATAAAADPIFVDRTAEAGLDFHHFNGMSGRFYFAEVVGAGGALLDFDGDGDLDLYLVQGRMLGPDSDLPRATFPPRHPLPLEDRLYRNDLTVLADGSRAIRFTDVTAASGIESTGYGMGVAAADVDNDGRTDLYVTNFGSNQLLRNRGDLTFEDITSQSGTDDPRWSTSAAFFDYDRDGWLDLFVTNYVRYDAAKNVTCYATSSRRDYCGPSGFEPSGDSLFRNRGVGADGAVTFEDVSASTGIARQAGAGLGVVAADLDDDGWTDLYVANDGQANFLWINQRGAAGKAVTFLDDALLAGVALNRQGRPEASMGVDAGDFDNDGDVDLFMTHLMGETNTLYVNDGGLFEDRTIETGLGPGSLSFTSFGTPFVDYDNDGWLDLLAANGEVKVIPALEARGDPHPLHQTNQLFHNLGKGPQGGVRFEEVTARAGEVFRLSEVSRGVAVGDVDNDGDADVLLLNNNGPARLLINGVGQGNSPSVRNHWLGLRLVGGQPSRDRLGAWVEVARPGRLSLWRRAGTGGSFLSASDPRVLVGLGRSPRRGANETTAQVERVVVTWPGGRREQWQVQADRYTTLREGSGTPAK